MARNPAVDLIFNYFSVADMRDIATSAKWAPFAKDSGFKPSCKYFFDGDSLAVIEAGAIRWFNFATGAPLCLRICSTFKASYSTKY